MKTLEALKLLVEGKKIKPKTFAALSPKNEVYYFIKDNNLYSTDTDSIKLID